MTEDKEKRYIQTCAQLYQVIGFLLDETGRFDSESGEAALDMASDGANGDPQTHREDILPWPYEEDLRA